MTATANASELSPAAVRAEIARSNLRHYIVAARAEINPARLSSILNERAPLPERLAQRILEAIKDK